MSIQSHHDLSAYPVIDGHCDALLAVIGKSQIPGDTGRRDFLVRNAISHVDLPKLLEGGVRCQFMALFAEDEDVPEAKAYTHRMLDEFEAICSASGGAFFPLLSGVDLERTRPHARVGALLSIEGGEALDGSLEALEEFFARGVRALGITWNRRNPFGRGVRAEGDDGLTQLGRALVRKMENLKMIVDASHLSDQAFADLVDVASGPIVASHSNARAVHEHPRNLTDAQIRTISDSGGVVGAVFVPNFIAPAVPTAQENRYAYLERYCDHLMHVIRVGGIECAALGSDFDGYKGVEGHVLADASEYPVLSRALAGRGLDSSELRAVMGDNWARVIREVLP